MKVIISIPDFEYVDEKVSVIPWSKAYFINKALMDKGHDILLHFSKYQEKSSTITRILKQSQYSKRNKYFNKFSQKIIEKLGFQWSSQELKNNIIKYKPDLILFIDQSYFSKELLLEIKTITNAKLIFLLGTSPAATVSRMRIFGSAPYFDYIFTSDIYHAISWVELGAARAECLPISACEPNHHFPPIFNNKEERERFNSDVSFVGRLNTMFNKKRIDYLLKLCEKFDIAIWSPDIDIIKQHPFLKKYYRGCANKEDMIKAIGGSKISLNFHSQYVVGGGNMRLFEIPATKTLQIVDYYNEEWFIEGEEIVSFDNHSDLEQKIEYYLANPVEREKIAEAGYKKVYQHHTYKNRVNKIMDKLKKEKY